MSVETTYTHVRDHLAKTLDRVVDDREIVIVRRRNAKDVAMIAADELSGILETLHLLQSPANASRLIAAVDRARERQGKSESIDDLRREFGLDEPGT